jgi:hypothetical protein
MKCMKKTIIHECCSVMHIRRDTTSEHVPEWVRKSLTSGILVIDRSSGLLIRAGFGLRAPEYRPLPNDGYIVRDPWWGITGMTADEFNKVYEIVD